MTTQKLSFWPNSKTENMTKDKLKLRQNKNSDKKLSLWQNPKNPDSDKIQLKSWKLNFWKNLKKSLLVRTPWHLNNQWDLVGAAFCNLAMFSTVDVFTGYAPLSFQMCYQTFGALRCLIYICQHVWDYLWICLRSPCL